jgi:hypothetical protein
MVQAVLKLVDTFTHVQKSFVRLLDTGECIEQSIRNVVDETWGRFESWWVGDMLMHVNMLVHDGKLRGVDIRDN